MRYELALTATLFSAGVIAFPRLPLEDIAVRQVSSDASISQKETNCGPSGACYKFDATEQFVSITGDHKFIKPKTSDIRGPCPGLNAAANHNYLPRNGVPTILQTINGLGQAYGMSVDLAGFLAAYAVVLDGDIVTRTWSIGGPPPYKDVTGLLSPPQGISYSHNKYEGDTSIGRNDAYLANGDAYSLNTTRFGYAFRRGQNDGSDRYTLDKFRRDVRENQIRSIQQNPYYFAPLFSTTLVAPAAYNFVANFMSNHSAAEPSGYLDGDMFKTFFSVTGDFDNSKESSGYGFTWQPGLEKIPNNWYRRPSSNQYSADDVVLDLAIGWAAYPKTFRFGGNTHGVNTYQGVDIATLTGGSFTNADALKPKNFKCLLFQTQQQVIPDQLKGGINDVAASLKLIDLFSGFLTSAGCAPLAKYDSSVFNQYPGHSYNPNSTCTHVGC